MPLGSLVFSKFLFLLYLTSVVLGFLVSITPSGNPHLYLDYKIKIGEFVGLRQINRQ
jgi:hypothetical protein